MCSPLPVQNVKFLQVRTEQYVCNRCLHKRPGGGVWGSMVVLEEAGVANDIGNGATAVAERGLVFTLGVSAADAGTSECSAAPWVALNIASSSS